MQGRVVGSADTYFVFVLGFGGRHAWEWHFAWDGDGCRGADDRRGVCLQPTRQRTKRSLLDQLENWAARPRFRLGTVRFATKSVQWKSGHYSVGTNCPGGGFQSRS